MTAPRYDVLGIGNAIVDVIARAEDDFLVAQGMHKGAMALIDTAIDTISEARATAGALISRFEFRGQQIATSLENIDAAKSAIMDVDLAAEQSKLVSNQVLVQAAVSAVSQANQIPQSLLRVLQ